MNNVSCVMVTYNRRGRVGRAITYFLRQDYPSRELLVVDDGTDPVADLIPDDDPRIRYVRLTGRRTIGAKRNIGCLLARGDIIVQWDDDDWMADWRLSYQIGAFLKQDADVSGLHAVLFHEPATGRCWRYEYQGRSPWVHEPTYCYYREFGMAHPFADQNLELDTRFLADYPGVRVGRLVDPSFYVGIIHSGNTAEKDTATAWWTPVPLLEIATLMGSDWDFYASALFPNPAD